MFDFIKNLFKKKPQEEPILEVEVKPKRKYKPRAPKVKVEEVSSVVEPVVEVIEPAAEPIIPAEKPDTNSKGLLNKQPRGKKKKR